MFKTNKLIFFITYFAFRFSVVMSSEGEVIETLYPQNEDKEILTAKKAITGLLAGKYLNKDKVRVCMSRNVNKNTFGHVRPTKI